MVLQLVVFLSSGKDGEWQWVRPRHLGVPKWKYVLMGGVCLLDSVWVHKADCNDREKVIAELVDDIVIR